MPGKQKLDQYFTQGDVAKWCWQRFLDIAKPDMDGVFVEPSAGKGAFSEVMKDVDTRSYELDEQLATDYGHIQADFLTLTDIKTDDKKLYFVGNPPFGYQGKIAKQFIQKAFELGAEYVGMIVPPGVRRIKQYGFHEVDQITLPFDTNFIDMEGKRLDVLNCLFIIYKRGTNNDDFFVSKPTCDNYVSMHTISFSKSKPLTKHAGKCDIYLPHSLWTSQQHKMRVYEDHTELKEMIGLKIKQSRDEVIDHIKNVDWYNKMTRTPHGACHLTHSIIKDELISAGFCD